MTANDHLPPTQHLVMDVLAARYRLGERLWPFPVSVGPALRALERAGLIVVMHGVAERTLRARLTETGEREALSATYNPPNGGFDQVRAALQVIADYAVRHAAVVPGMDSIADIARKALEASDA